MGKAAKVRFPCPGAAKAIWQAASDANGITACSRSVERSDTTGYDPQKSTTPVRGGSRIREKERIVVPEEDASRF